MTAQRMAPRRWRRSSLVAAAAVLCVVLLAVTWRWDWLIPQVEARASSAIGRQVTIGHLHLRPGRVLTVTADDVVVADPPGWPDAEPPLATVKRLTVQVDLWRLIRGQGLVLPLVALDRPRLYAAETPNGAANFRLAGGGGSRRAPPLVGELRISDGTMRVVVPKLRADFGARIATQGEGGTARVIAELRGTYAGQPITGRFTGGAILSLHARSHPWPVVLGLANGPTRLLIRGTMQRPLALTGTDVTLLASGPDLGLLQPLVGFPIPKTPAYEIGGKLDFEGTDRLRLDDIRGRMGNSDLSGTIIEAPGAATGDGKPKPVVTAELASRRVDLADLAGFIGGEPGRPTTALATPQQRATAARARASPRLLPETPIHVPQLSWADIHLRYRGAQVEGRSMPIDNVVADLDIVDGRVTLHPLSFGVGRGRLLAHLDMAPQSGASVRMRADIRLQNVDVGRLMAATHTFRGAGSLSGVGAIDATGDSVASLLANGNGEVKMAMAGGDLSALLVDLSGLEFGNALLSALGVPKKTTPIACFVGDLALAQGVLRIPAMVLETKEAVTNVGGAVNLRTERLDISLKTDSRHFSIGSLPARLVITGTLKDPAIRPGAQLAGRAGAAVGLGILFAPLAILPTVQLGTSAREDARCFHLLSAARASAGGGNLPAPRRPGAGERGAVGTRQ